MTTSKIASSTKVFFEKQWFLLEGNIFEFILTMTALVSFTLTILFAIILTDTFKWAVLTFIIVASSCLVFFMALLSFLADQQKQQVCILKAISMTTSEIDLTEGLIWAETNHWPVRKALEFSKFGYTLAIYEKHLQMLAKQYAEELAKLPPGEEYEEVKKHLDQICSTASWEKLIQYTKDQNKKDNEDLALSPRRHAGLKPKT